VRKINFIERVFDIFAIDFGFLECLFLGVYADR